MATQYREDIRKGVESLINCLICTDQFTSPKVLPCQHTFCLPCLEKFYISFNEQRIVRTSNFPCPQCRKIVYLPTDGLIALPNDFKVGQIQDVFDKIDISMEAKGANCDICRFEYCRSAAVSFCAECSKHLCTKCERSHAANPLFTTHSTVPLTDGKTRGLVCADHSEEVRYYCETCGIVLCTVCVLGKHAEHQIESVLQAMDSHRASIANGVQGLKKSLDVWELRAQHLASIKADNHKNLAGIKQKITAHTNTLITQLKEQTNSLCGQVEEAISELDVHTESELRLINSKLQGIQSTLTDGDRVLTESRPADLLTGYKNLKEQIATHSTPPNPLPATFLDQFVFVPNKDILIGELRYTSPPPEKEMSSILTSECIKSPSIASTSSLSLQSIVESASVTASSTASTSTLVMPTDDEHQTATSPSASTSQQRKSQAKKSSASSNIKRVKSGTSRSSASVATCQTGVGTGVGAGVSRSQSLREDRTKPRATTPTRTVRRAHSTAQNSRPASPAVQGIGRTAPSEWEHAGAGAADNYAKTSDPQGAKVQWKTMDHAHSRDASFLADGTVVVTEYRPGSDKLQLFDSSGSLKRCVACSSQNLIRPWGCAVNHSSGHIIVTDHGDRSVKVMDQDLSIRQVWRSVFVRPSGVAVMRSGEYVITDPASRGQMISIHSNSGIRKREWGTKGQGSGQLMSPHFTHVDAHDRILVSDALQKCVKVFDSRGKQILKITGSQGQPIEPYGICVDGQNHLLIADHVYGGVSLFSPDGRFIQHLVRTTGALPWGCALHDNGCLAVATDPSLSVYAVSM